MASIDLNSDLGENSADRVVGDDAAMLEIVTSANVSCGFHAGSPEGIRDTLAAAVGSTPLAKTVGAKLDARAGRLWPVLRYGVIPAALLLLSTAALVGDSYNPFIYFQF